MTNAQIQLDDIHWLMDILQNIDVGLVVLDRDYHIQLWNGFMESHSGISPQKARGENLFGLFPEIPKDWLMRKAEPVFQLKTRAFTIWEQRPYLFRFKNYRPITGRASVMYQNVSIIPLESVDRQVNHICLIIYDVTDIAVSREDARNAYQSLSELNRYDQLTGLLNRTVWLQELDREFMRCKRSVQPSTLVLIEPDHFRQINRQKGHLFGDLLLQSLASGLTQTQRQTDLSCRFNSEVFGALLVDTDEEEAMNFARRLLRLSGSLPGSDSVPGLAHLSVGIARFQNNFSDAASWLQAADKALYHARSSGGNQISVYQPGN